MSKPVPVTVAFGDGIGPFITEATLQILQSAGANIELNEIQVGEKSYLSGNSSGISEDSWKTILKNPIFLKISKSIGIENLGPFIAVIA